MDFLGSLKWREMVDMYVLPITTTKIFFGGGQNPFLLCVTSSSPPNYYCQHRVIAKMSVGLTIDRRTSPAGMHNAIQIIYVCKYIHKYNVGKFLGFSG